MGVGRMVEDCVVDNFVDIVAGNMVEVPEAFVVDNLGFMEGAFVVQHWPHRGSSGI
jgi:hypothetical protein